MNTHTVKSFDEDLRQLRVIISQMGGMAEVQLTGSIDALIDRDVERAMQIINADAAMDRLEAEAERFAVELIARRAPLADDLREVVSALKLASALERMGDYAKNIAKRSTVLAQMPRMQSVVIVREMMRVCVQMLNEVLDAYGSRDTDKALNVRDRDRDVDDLYNTLFRTLLTFMMENPTDITPSTHLLFIAKNLERIGDLTTNMAEIVYYIVTGNQLVASRAKTDDTAFAIVSGEDDNDS